MGHEYIVISILLCFLCAPCYHSFDELVDGGVNLMGIEKNATLSVPKPFRLAPGTKFQDGEGITVAHYAMWHTEPGKYHGFRAEISIWDSPNIQYYQESGASIQIYCQDGEQQSLIEVGFHVCPSLYNSTDVHFFTYWTKDTKSAGCINLHCPGFVPASGGALVPGQTISPPSIYGKVGYYISLSINEDPNSRDWILYRHDLDTPSFLGHFPRELCPTTSRTQALTGFVYYPNTTSGPTMGSGHFPSDDELRSAYFRHVKTYDAKGHAWDLLTFSMSDLVDKLDCYMVTDFEFHFINGNTFYYGGPSGCGI